LDKAPGGDLLRVAPDGRNGNGIAGCQERYKDEGLPG